MNCFLTLILETKMNTQKNRYCFPHFADGETEYGNASKD